MRLTARGMDIRFSPEEEQFRLEARAWLETHVPKAPRPQGLEAQRDYELGWQRTLFDAGYAGINWPAEYGGRGAALMEQLVWFEEYARVGAPETKTHFVGLKHAGPTLIACGTPEQKAFHLPKILRGDVVWCQGFSEPNAGSDLANLQTKAVTPLTTGYDNFPLWSPRGDLIMFSRAVQNNYDIYTIRPDGTGVKRLTSAKGNDAHMAWSPDGESIVFASTRLGFKDEGTYTDAPQPYGELFVMRYDGTLVEPITDNQWEDGTPAWQPTGGGR